jgi:hypothetical protein
LPALFSLEGTNVPRDSTLRAFDREHARRLTFFENCIEKNFHVSRERHRKRPFVLVILSLSKDGDVKNGAILR